MGDLKSPKLMVLKAVLFLCGILISAGLIFTYRPNLQTVFLLGVLIWCSARLYYFMFYVIENYIDSHYKFSGIYSLVRYLVCRKPAGKMSNDKNHEG